MTTREATEQPGPARPGPELAVALTPDQVHSMVDEALSSETLLGLRDALVICLSWECMLRPKELVALDVADLKVKKKRVRLVVRTRRDPEGDPDVPDASRVTAELVRAWLEVADIDQGALFRGVSKSGRVLDARLSTRALSLIVKRWAAAAGIEGRVAHGSFRIGAYLHLPAALVRPPAGGWPWEPRRRSNVG